jgi:hypothetical protein
VVVVHVAPPKINLAPPLAFEKSKKTNVPYADGYFRNRSLTPEAEFSAL